MAVTVEESVENQTYEITSDGFFATKVFNVFNAQGAFEAITHADIPEYDEAYYDSLITPAVGPFVLLAKKISCVNAGRDDLHIVTVNYEYRYASTDRPSNPSDGDEIYKYDPTGDTVRVSSALATQTKYGADVTNEGSLIGVTAAGEVEGVDILDTSEVLTVTQWKSTVNVTEAYMNNIRAVRNKYNTVAWYGAAAGEVLFTGVRQVGKNATTTELEFTFLISRNKTAPELPTYTNANGTPYTISGGKKGWQYLWEQAAETTDGAGKPKRYSRGVYVADVYKTDNFSGLGLTGTV